MTSPDASQQIRRAEHALAAGDPTAAMRAAQAALDADPECAAAHLLLGRIMRAAGEIEIAIRHMKTASVLVPGSAAYALEFAELLAAQGRFAEAARSIARAVAAAPDAAAPAVAEVDLVVRAGDPHEAAARADRLLARFPHHIGAIRTAALAHSAVGRHDEARGPLERVLANAELAPTLRGPLLFVLARVRERAGDHDGAWAAASAANATRGLRLDREAHRHRIDRIVGSFDAPMAGTSASTALRPIFIVGMPRSGTTLLEQILASHPLVAGAGELGLLERTEHRLGADAPFPESLAAAGPDHVAAMTRFAHEALSARAGDHPVVTEKSVSNALYLGLVPGLFPNARIVFCAREPLDTCVSCYFIDFDAHLPYAYDLADLGVYHASHDRLVAHWRSVLPLPWTTVTYEELVAHPEREIRALLEFCGLPFDAQCLAFHENRRAVTTASAEQVRKPMYTTSVGRHEPYAQHLDAVREALT